MYSFLKFYNQFISNILNLLITIFILNNIKIFHSIEILFLPFAQDLIVKLGFLIHNIVLRLLFFTIYQGI